ncbi:hypothetical protein ACSTH7_25310, partial [Vibrio parahaemolyticus]
NLLSAGHASYIELGKSEKVVYYTPRFAGFQAGVSFAPDGCYVTGNSGGANSGQGNAAYPTVSGPYGCGIFNGTSNQ